mmetsp:Transcript_16144/g.20689  ORF Transcript_16144/g.20689 Transcript_16144/m.20689 type:complete len:153 (-) Transcript_16144:366-824(-)
MSLCSMKSLFQSLPISTHDAQSFGYIDIQKYGVTVVQVSSKREANLVAAMGAGNRVAASVTRNGGNGNSIKYSNLKQSNQKLLTSEKPVSHLIFTFWVESKDPISGKTCQGKLNIVELASIQTSPSPSKNASESNNNVQSPNNSTGKFLYQF